MNTIFLEKAHYKGEDIFYVPKYQMDYFNKKNVVTNIKLKGKDIAEIIDDKISFEDIIPINDGNNILNQTSYFKNAPTIGVILQKRDGDYEYSVSYNYVKALLDSGANIKFLDSINIDKQILVDIHGLLLPAGFIPYPSDYNDKDVEDVSKYLIEKLKNNELSHPLKAYVSAALKSNLSGIPVLAISGGAQVFSNIMGIKMLPVKDLTSKNHLDPTGNRIHGIYKTSLKFNSFPSDKRRAMVNSYHSKTVDEKSVKEKGFDVFAKSTDGLVEAWGTHFGHSKGSRDVLCTQWQPEWLYAKYGNEIYLKPYEWLVKRATEFNNYKGKAFTENNKIKSSFSRDLIDLGNSYE